MNDLCASIQQRIVSILLNKLKKASIETGIKNICIAGGVSANSGLRKTLEEAGKKNNLVDAGGKLPVIITFVDTEEHVNRVLPTLKEMAAHRLIVRENVVLEQGNLD